MCLVASIAAAQGTTDDRLMRIGGEEIAGDLLGVGADGVVRVRVAGGETRAVPLDDVMQIRLAAVGPRTGETASASVWLRSGQALPATFAGARPTGVALRLWFARSEVVVPWRFVEAMCFERSAVPDPGFAAAVAAHGSEHDLVYAKREDGHVVRVSSDGVTILDDRVKLTVSNEERELPLDRVHGVVFASISGTRPDPQPKPRVRLTLVNGQRVAGKIDHLADATCFLLLPEGVTLDIDMANLARIDVESDRLLELTDLQPAIEQIPALDTVWPPLVDQRPGGGEIRLGGKRFARGLVVVPFTRLTYGIDGGFDSFSAIIGFEEGAGATGEAIFRVRGDGRVLFDSGAMSAAELPRTIDVPVNGVRQLALEVDFGGRLNIGCTCVFASPRLRKG